LYDYELLMVVSPEADEDRVTGLVDRVASYVTEGGGSISNQENWGVRRLAYPIQRFQEGNYMLTQFVLDPKLVLELDRTLVASEDVLRHLVTRIEKPEPKEQPPEPTEEPPGPRNNLRSQRRSLRSPRNNLRSQRRRSVRIASRIRIASRRGGTLWAG